MAQNALTPDQFAEIANVSRETLDDLLVFVDLLKRWNKQYNLVGSATLSDVWRRHILDSAQILDLIPGTAKSLLDMGSGAGLPGIVLALLMRPRTDVVVTLLESNKRKCTFLRAVIHTLNLRADVMCCRIETLEPYPADVVTARAVAPLNRLLELAMPFLGPASLCVFPKGRHLEVELTEAAKYWSMAVTQIPSKSDPASRILCLEGISRV